MLVAVLVAPLAAESKSTLAIAEPSPVDSVDPFIGTSGHGHTYPGASVPFGMVQLSPDTRTQTWDGCSGYHYSDNRILGFSHTHLSGTGCGDLGDLRFIPIAGKAPEKCKTDSDYKVFASTFEHKDETASAGYYSVTLKPCNIKVELTATKRVGFHRYTFSGSKESTILVDLTEGISDKPIELTFKLDDDHTISGMRRSAGWAKNQYLFFVAKFSKPIKSCGTTVNSGELKPGASEVKSKTLGAWLTFDTADGSALLAKVGISTASTEGALRHDKRYEGAGLVP